MAAIASIVVLPVPSTLLTSALAPQYRWVAYAAVMVWVMSVLMTLPGNVFSRERYGQSRFVRLLSIVLFIVYAALAVWIGMADEPAVVSYVALVSLWGAVSTLVVASARSSGRRGQIAAGMGAFLVSAGLLIEAAQGVSSPPMEQPRALAVSPLVFLSAAWMVYAAALVRGKYVLLGLALVAMGLCDVCAQASAFYDGRELLGVARLVKAVAFFLAGYAWIRWSRPAGAGALALFGGGWSLEGMSEWSEGHAAMTVGNVLLAVALFVTAAVVGRLGHLMNASVRIVCLRVATALAAGTVLCWGIGGLALGDHVTGVGLLLVGACALIMSMKLDPARFSFSRTFDYWFGQDGGRRAG